VCEDEVDANKQVMYLRHLKKNVLFTYGMERKRSAYLIFKGLDSAVSGYTTKSVIQNQCDSLTADLSSCISVCLVPHYTTRRQKHVSEQLAQGRYAIAKRPT